MQRLALVSVVALGLAVLSGCSGDEAEQSQAAAASSSARCPAAWQPGWQALANRIGAPVYCPSWLPDPLTGELEGRWNNINSVGRDGSYLMGFTWYEVPSGEIHVNLRGHPRSTKVPTCGDGSKKVPCFADPSGRKRVGALEVTVYTANRGADRWHVLYAWKHRGSLYTLSEHVAPPLTYRKVVRNLDRMLRGLVLIEPARA